MRFLIEYFISCFCKHEWKLLFKGDRITLSGQVLPYVTYRCEKCGHKKTYKP